MDGFLSSEGCEDLLIAELQDCFPGASVHASRGVVCWERERPSDGPLPCIAFARQYLPNARQVDGASVNAWSRALCDTVRELPPEGPWFLHVEPHYSASPPNQMTSGARSLHTEIRHARGKHAGPRKADFSPTSHPHAGSRRCELITEEVQKQLQRHNRDALRRLSQKPQPFQEDHTLIQALLVTPEAGFISIAPAPLPYLNRHLVSHLPKGHVPVAVDKAAPSRAFAKLVEAQLRLGRAIKPGETCVDLGASPGSWTYVAAQAGASVTAIDRSPLRADLMQHRRVTFLREDAFQFTPARTVGWLLCDVIADPGRLTDLLVKWLRHRWCRAFVFTIKLKMAAPGEALAVLATLKQQVPHLCSRFMLTRLEANKHEVCAFGMAK